MSETKVIRIAEIDLADDRFQSRLDFADSEIQQLASDIEVNGLRNPIGLWLRPDGTPVLLYGFQRLKAIQLLGRDSIEAKIYEDLTIRQAFIQNFSDNIRHEDLTDLEIALRLRFFRDELGYDHANLADLLGKGQTTTYNLIRLTNLEQEIQLAVHNQEIGLQQALEIGRFPDFKRLKILQQTIRDSLSVRDLKRTRGISQGTKSVSLTLPTSIAEILQGLPSESQSKIMERIMNFGTRPHNPIWYTHFGRAGPVHDAVRWKKEISLDGTDDRYYEMFVRIVNSDIPKYGCEYSLTIAAIDKHFICPNSQEWAFLANRQTMISENPLHNRPAWFFWCGECIEEMFPNTRFLEDYYWYPEGSTKEPYYQHIIHKDSIEASFKIG